MSDIVQRAMQSCANDFTAWLDYKWTAYKKVMPTPCESPIEEALLVAMYGLDLVSPTFIFEGEVRKRAMPLVAVHVRPQAKVDRYRVDFMLETEKDGKIVDRLAIECDGFAFHDRTKEQAARDKSRDRYFVGKGIRVLRFTGSEIYGNVSRCMSDIYAALNVGER